MNQDLRKIIDAITTECSEMIQSIQECPEYFTDDWDRSICESFLGIKNLLLKYAAKYDEKILKQNSTQEDPGDIGSDTGAPQMS